MSQSQEETERVLALIEAAEHVDGFAALNEAASLRLRHRPPGTRSFLRTEFGRVIGYGQLDGAPGDVAEAALVVHPEHRRRGLGTELLRELLAHSGQRLEIWAVRGTPAAAGLAAKTGLLAVRELLVMRRTLADPIDLVPPPPGVEIRSFRPGQDEEAWLRVNGRAFADHPEQGGWTLTDLRQRMAEPWFEPAGLLLATRSAEVIGFHWTKPHPGRLGEVYVLGVDPDAGVRGLGRALLAAGLTHLRDDGATEVQLYVDATNTRAVQLYERAAFDVASRDVMYASPQAARHARL